MKKKVKYRITWVATRTGKTGSGKPIFETKEDALEVCRDRNQEDSDIGVLHGVEAVYAPPA
jgi:hypothetical protein